MQASPRHTYPLVDLTRVRSRKRVIALTHKHRCPALIVLMYYICANEMWCIASLCRGKSEGGR